MRKTAKRRKPVFKVGQVVRVRPHGIDVTGAYDRIVGRKYELGSWLYELLGEGEFYEEALRAQTKRERG